MSDDQPHIGDPSVVFMHGMGQAAVRIRVRDGGARLEITKGPALENWLSDTTLIASPFAMGEFTTIREANMRHFTDVMRRWLHGEGLDI